MQSPGKTSSADRVRFTLDDEAIEASRGDSIAAAMIAVGKYHFRDSKNGGPRGLFCGMGVCGECQVLINGASKRACLEKVSDGQDVRRHPARRELKPTNARTDVDNWQEEQVDVLVVGAGPAGLSAAIAVAKSGLDVLVIDERSQAGGQYFKQPAVEYNIDDHELDNQFREGADLVKRAMAAGVRYQAGATAWATFNEEKLAFTVNGETRLVTPRRFILANGAYERPLPVPGWTLPGVMTTGAVQTLLRAYRTSPGQRVLVAGNGPLNFQVARELGAAGATVVAIAEAAASPLRSPLNFLRMAIADPALSLDGVRQFAALKRAGVPLHFRHSILRLDGDEKVESATIGRVDDSGRLITGSASEYEVDAVCMNYGFLPQGDLARSLGCEFTFNAQTASWTAQRDAECRTSVPGVFLVGDAAGLGGARVAMAEGAIAGHAIAVELGADEHLPAATLAPLRRQLRRNHRFQAALWTMFDAPLLATQFTTADTLVCRCENIARRDLDSVMSDHCHSLGAVKKITRAGMGRCQGRYCALSMAALGAELGFEKTDAAAFFAPRPPFKPLTVRDIAGSAGGPPSATEVLSTDDRYANISPR